MIAWAAAVLFAAAAQAAPPSAWLDFELSSAALLARCGSARVAAEARLAELAKVEPAEAGFDGTVKAFSDTLAAMSDRVAAPAFLGEVSTDAGVRDAGHACDTETSRFLVDVYGREDLYRVLKGYAAGRPALAGRSPAVPALAGAIGAAGLEGEDARLLEKVLLDFKRNGLDLPKEKREEVQAIKKRIVELETEFRKELGEVKTTVPFTREQLAGLPEDLVARLARDGDRYRVSLDYPDYYPFMENARDPAARRELDRQFNSRGAPANVVRLSEALKLRTQAAALLGYPSHAHYVLEQNMAKTPEAVSAFLKGLRSKLERKARPELAVLAGLKDAEEGAASDHVLREWDWRYYHKQLMKSRYQVDDQKVKEYFPLDVVTAGMLQVYQELLGVLFAPVQPAEAWHPDVQLYRVNDAESGALVGHFYMDLFPREGKYKHAAAFGLIPGRLLPDGTYQRPVAAMVANFEKPTPDKPSLLRHSEVEVFFHEFGHIMHQALTKAKHQRFSGTGVARDFVEAPSQMLENWVWQPDVLARLSGHYRDRTKKLPRALLDRMVAAKNLDSGIIYLRQAFFASVDLAFHTGPVDDTTKAWARLMEEVRLIPMTPGAHPEAGFGHLMGGYDAGYYGYLWSEVFAQDMFSRFERKGVLDPELGRDYRRLILEAGSSVEEAASLRAFLGREPSDEPFLRSIGLEAPGGPKPVEAAPQ